VNLNNGGHFALVCCGNTAQSGRGKYSVIRGLPVGIETDVAVPPTPLQRGARMPGSVHGWRNRNVGFTGFLRDASKQGSYRTVETAESHTISNRERNCAENLINNTVNSFF